MLIYVLCNNKKYCYFFMCIMSYVHDGVKQREYIVTHTGNRDNFFCCTGDNTLWIRHVVSNGEEEVR